MVKLEEDSEEKEEDSEGVAIWPEVNWFIAACALSLAAVALANIVAAFAAMIAAFSFNAAALALALPVSRFLLLQL